MSDKRNTHAEQVLVGQELAERIHEEATRRSVSRGHVVREALLTYLGMDGEGATAPARRENPGKNYGRK